MANKKIVPPINIIVTPINIGLHENPYSPDVTNSLLGQSVIMFFTLEAEEQSLQRRLAQVPVLLQIWTKLKRDTKQRVV